MNESSFSQVKTAAQPGKIAPLAGMEQGQSQSLEKLTVLLAQGGSA